MMFSQILRLSTATSTRFLLFDSLKVDMGTKFLSAKNVTSKAKQESKFKPVTHVIFDLDGLLLDTEVIYKQIITEIVKSYGKEYTQEIRLKVLGTTELTTARTVIEECTLPLTVNEFLDRFRDMQIHDLSKAKLMEGAERLIRHLNCNRVPIAVATSSGDKSVAVKIQNYKDLFQLFSHIVMGSTDPEVKVGKPAPDIFLVCARRFEDRPEPEKCLVFEDAPNGVTAAVSAGMQVVMVPETDLPAERTAHATLVLKTLLDFKPEDFGLPPFDDKM